MTLKRRGFLQMLGGAFTAPLMPSASFGAAAKAGYPASALYAAMGFAKSDVSFSVFTLAKRLGLPHEQALQLMKDLLRARYLGAFAGHDPRGQLGTQYRLETSGRHNHCRHTHTLAIRAAEKRSSY